LSASVVATDSQPLPASESQSLNPVKQAKLHIPLPHVGRAFVTLGQTRRHMPQFAMLTEMFTSQPFEASVSQSAKPGTQSRRQVPPPQTGVVFSPPRGQTVPHAPQLAVVVRVSTSQPFAGFASQFAKPGLQVNPQVPAVHVATEFATGAHALPHIPQCVVLDVTSASQPFAAVASQLPNPIAQRRAQAPAAQVAVEFAPEGQTARHEPQLAMSARTSVSHPEATLPSQSPKPALHVMPQVPAAQAGAEFAAVAHIVVHVPQLVTLLAVLVSQPLALSRSQFWNPLVHVSPHTPTMQVRVALTAL